MAEQRLIDANEAIEIAKEYYWVFERSRANLTDLREVLKDCTIIETKPVVHAHWEPKKIMARTPFARNYYCSNCKDEPLECKHICGNCGAQMDEKEDKHEDYT